MAKVRRQRGGKRSVKPRPRRTATPPQENEGGMSFVIYGPSGVGKTSLAAHFPRPIFLYDAHEDGIIDLVKYNQCPEPVDKKPIGSWDALLAGMTELATDLSALDEYDTLVLDSLTGFEQYCFQHCCDEDYDGDWSSKGFYSYQQGPSTAATRYWEPEFINAAQGIVNAGKTIILLAHSEVKKFEDPTSAGYERYQPYLHKQLWKKTERWAKCILFYNYWAHIVQPDGSLKKKPDMNSEARNIYTVHSAAFDAKNRFGLEPTIDAGGSGQEAYDNLQAAFAALS